MTHNPEAAQRLSTPLTDAQVAALVRDTADGWQMPPVLLDRGGWRQHVRKGRGSGSNRPMRGMRQLGRAFALALALVLAAAVTGVVLTRLRVSHVATSIPASPPVRSVSGSTRSPSPSGPTAAGLSSLGRDKLLVRLDSGYAVVDVANGTIGRRLPVDDHGSLVRQLDDGSLACICLSQTSVGGSVARYTIEWRHMDADGNVSSRRTLGTYVGTPDPRGQGPDAYENATIEISSGDGNTVYIGWSTRKHPTWHSGLAAVDISTGDVLQRLDLPDRDDGPDRAPVVVVGPRVVGSAGANRVLIDRAWYSDGPSISGQSGTFQQGFDAFVARSTTSPIEDPRPFDGLDSCGSNATRAGSVSSGNWWAACFGDNGTTIRRFDAGDVALGDALVPSSGLDAFSPDSIAAIDPVGPFAYEWNPYDLTLVKVDLFTGTKTVATGAAADGDVLAWLGNWLAPAAEAKIFLTPSFVLSPDGTRGYALGTTVPTSDESTTSTGIYVFDTAGMTAVAHWPAAADFQSIAASADGTTVFLAGGVATGSVTQWPSITAVDAFSGAVRATVSDLGHQGFYFVDPQQP